MVTIVSFVVSKTRSTQKHWVTMRQSLTNSININCHLIRTNPFQIQTISSFVTKISVTTPSLGAGPHSSLSWLHNQECLTLVTFVSHRYEGWRRWRQVSHPQPMDFQPSPLQPELSRNWFSHSWSC